MEAARILREALKCELYPDLGSQRHEGYKEATYNIAGIDAKVE